MHNKVKRIVAVLLALTLVVTSFVFFDLTALFPTAQATDYDVKIAVPETVYVNPTSTKNARFYANNVISSSGTFSTINGFESVGRFYLYSTMVQAITNVTISGATHSGLTVIDDLTNNYVSDTSFSITLSNNLEQNTTLQLEWEITCEMKDETTQVFHAYTVAYSPNRNVTATAVTGFDYRGDEANASGLIYIQGAHVAKTASYVQDDPTSWRQDRYQNVSSGVTRLDPLVFGVATPSSDVDPYEYGVTSTPFTGAMQSVSCDNCVKNDNYNGSGNWTHHLYSNLTPAEVYADTSRISNTAQIPYLRLRFMITSMANCNQREHWYVSDATSVVSGGNNPTTAKLNYTASYNGSNTTVNLLAHSRWREDDFCRQIWAMKGSGVYGTVLRGSDSTPTVNDGYRDITTGEYYNNAIDYNLSGGSTVKYFRFGVCGSAESHGRTDSSWAMSSGFVLLRVNTVNKSALREKIQECNKYTVSYYPGAQFTNFLTALKDAAFVLGNPTATSAQISSATTSLTNAANGLVYVAPHTHKTADNKTIFFEEWTSTTSLPTSGSYYLSQNVTVDATTTLTGNLNLCLGGKTVTMTGTGSVLSITSGKTLNLFDEPGDHGVITGGNTEGNGGGILSHGRLNLYGGTITGNSADTGGGIASYSTFNLYGGTITDNSADTGGGVSVQDGTMDIYGGSISGNTASYYGGGVYASHARTLNLHDGAISGNSAKEGGGAFLNGGFSQTFVFTMSGGAISDNTASYSAGGVYLDTYASFILEDGTISGNTSQMSGGGAIKLNGTNTSAEIKGGSITGNFAQGNGGALCMSDSGMIEIKGGSITGNTAYKGGGIYQLSTGTVSIQGGTIRDNTAKFLGDALCSQSTADDAVTLSGGTVSGSMIVASPITITGSLGNNVYSVGKITGVTRTIGVVTSGLSGYGTIANFVNGNGNGFSLSENADGEVQIDRAYQIAWENYDGTSLENDENVPEGTTPTYDGETPTRASDSLYDYTFDCWDPEVVAAAADATYTATYTAVPNYTVPQGLTAFYGQTLADVTLPEGWSWDDETTRFNEIGDNTFSATYQPDPQDDASATEILTVTVSPAFPTAAAPTGLTATYGQTLGEVTLTNPSGNTDGEWEWANDLSTLLDELGEHSFPAVFTPNDTTNYYGAMADLTVTVVKATPDYTLPTGLTATYGDTLEDVALPSGWAWDDALSTPVGDVGTRSFPATFTPNDTANYDTVQANVTVTVNKGTPTYTAPTLTAKIGQTLSDVTLPTGWTWADALSTPVGALGEHTFGATYNPDPNNYNDALALLTVTVLPNDQQFVSIDDQIALTLLLNLASRGKTEDDVTITLDNESYTCTGTPVAKGQYAGLYKFTIVMAPAQIADEIVVTIDGDAQPLTTSVKNYCTTLSGSAYDAYVKEQALARAILAYGQAANNAFGYSADTIADISGLDVSAAQNAAAVFSDSTGKVTGASFMALTKPEFRFYTGNNITEEQAVAYNQAGITATMDAAKADTLNARFVKKADNSVLLEVTGVSAENMDKTITVTVTGLGTITFNGNAFARAMAKSGNETQQNLGAALYCYGAAAKTCFGA